MKSWPSKRKYLWTPAIDRAVTLAWSQSNKWKLSKAIDTLERATKFPRHMLKLRAKQLGLTTFTGRRVWTEEEIEFLHEYAGRWKVKAIAARLGRGWQTVASYMQYLKLSCAVREGYSRVEIKACFGVSTEKVADWIERGWLKVNRQTDRISETSVERFVRHHPEEYSLKRVDETWFKGVLFAPRGRFEEQKHRPSKAESDLQEERRTA